MRALAACCPACREIAIPLASKLFAALHSNVRCPACGVAVSLSLWPRVVHLVLGELAVAGGFVASLILETPLYVGLASASWFAFGVALPLSHSPAEEEANKPRRFRSTDSK